jgi:phosphohistidine phosphatase SixA
MRSINCRLLMAALTLGLATAALAAQTVPRSELAAALRSGGYVIVMRHASSPHDPPDAAHANADNTGHERQLDETGRRDAAAMGAALKRLKIPVNEVLASPTYRALETARLLDVGQARAVDELGNEGMAATGEARAAWLRQQVARSTQPGGNRLLITHGPNISAAFPEYSAGMGEGEALIFDPRGKDGPVMVQRIKIGEWAGL